MTWQHPGADDALTCPDCTDEAAIALYPEEYANAHTDPTSDPEDSHAEPSGEDDEGRPLCWCGHLLIAVSGE